jgi:peptidoglycan/xylan/chitin deacetylase (PgdA/CDA1 family)
MMRHRNVVIITLILIGAWCLTAGGLITSSVQAQTDSLNRGIITLTFDDGWKSQYVNALPEMRRYGFKGTFYIYTSVIGTDSERMTVSNLRALRAYGNEIGSHTVTHPDLTQISDAQLVTELSQSKTSLEAWLGTGTVKNFACPSDGYNTHTTSYVDNYYRSQRTVDVGWNTKGNFLPYLIRTQNIDQTTTPQQVGAWVNQAKADKYWLVLVYHQVTNSPDLYDVSVRNFKNGLSKIKASGVPVLTIDKALDEVMPQI